MDSLLLVASLPDVPRTGGWRLPALVAVAVSVVAACGGSDGGTTPVRVPANIAAQAGGGETLPVGTAVATPPSVKVSDVDGNGVPGVPVTFAVTAGDGSVSPVGPVNTNAVGVAASTSWTLGGSPGPQALSASASGVPGSPVAFSATGLAAFTVQVTFLPGTNPDSSTQAIFQAAAARWGQVITGDLPDVNVTNLDIGACVNRASFVITQFIDDIVIFAEITSIDGPGGILGSIRPCYFRSTAPGLPEIGYMKFDVADTAFFSTVPGGFQTLVLHEMAHVVGFGGNWGGLLNTNTQNPSDPFFQGTHAINAFLNTNGGTNPFMGRTAVPVQANGGLGNAFVHWDETLFGSELMTGLLSGTSQPMSATTIASFKDMGYVVDLSRADAWHANNPGIRGLGPRRLPPIRLVGEVVGSPLGAITPDGTLVPLPH